MSIFQKLSLKLGLTDTELKVNLFLLVILVVGIFIKVFNWEIDAPAKENFDYSETDSIFYSTNNNKLQDNLIESNLGSSDLPKGKLNSDKKRQGLLIKSVDLNNASMDQLTMLPGIGIKTAERILAYRRASGGFNNINELLEVNGIGDTKFDKIKKYIYIK